MCSACDDIALEQFALDDPVVLEARKIEQSMYGEPVPETAWRVFLHQSSEPISWKQYERVRAAMDEAKARPVHPTLKAQRMRQSLACEAVS